MNRPLLSLLFCAFAAPGLSFAQSDNLPVGNPVQFPTGNAQWTIDIIYAATAAPTPNSGTGPRPTPPRDMRLKQIEVTQAENTRRTISTTSDGKKTEFWFDVPTQVITSTNTPGGTPVCYSNKDPLMMSVLKTGFEPSSFEWINKDRYINSVNYKGLKCWHYKGSTTMSSDDQKIFGGSGVVNLEAWVDQDSRLPVALSDGARTGVYAFAKTPPAGPLVMPKAIADELKFYTTPLIPNAR